jgi:hypothetical protein
MADVVAATEAAVVIMHNRAEKDASIDIVSDIRRFFDRSLALAEGAGIPRDRIVLDPGIGFAKTSHQNRDAIAGRQRSFNFSRARRGGEPCRPECVSRDCVAVTQSSLELARDKCLNHLARLVGLGTRFRDPFVNGVFEHVIVAGATGSLVGLGEFFLHLR